MARELEVPARRSLLAKPQRLGFLPTMWFWNDWETQRLLMPFVLMSVPLFLLIHVLQRWIGLSAWIPITTGLVVPYLMMGLVERYVRAQARLRPPEAIDEVRPIVTVTRRVHGPALALSTAVASGALTLSVLLQASPVALGVTAVCGLALVAVTLRYGRSRARSLAEVNAGRGEIRSGEHEAPPR
jgi:hypothetical protein